MSMFARRLQRAVTTGYQGTSIGTNGHRLSEMFGGDGNGSWINTPMPDTTSLANPQLRRLVTQDQRRRRQHPFAAHQDSGAASV